MPSIKDISPFVPFDLYDFFGYLFPGILFATNSAILLHEMNPTLFSSLYPIITVTKDSELTFIGGVGIILASIVFLYTLGHFIATLSHIIIDRVLVDGIEGYPINFLLNIHRETREYSESTFKYLFTLYNVMLLIPVIFGDAIKIKTYLIWALAGVVFLIIQRTIIMIVRQTKGKDFAFKVGNIKLFRLYLLPAKYIIDPIIGFQRRLLGMDRKFPDSFIALYKDLFHKRFNPLIADDVASENYWLSSFHSTSEHEFHQRVLHTWLHLYGFARNASAAFYISGTMIIVYVFFGYCPITDIVRIHLGITWLLAAVLGLRYWILYSHYYSKGVIRVFIESVTEKNN
jgi:hypothetical protein